MLTHAPLPSWAAVVRALFRRPGSATELAAPWRSDATVVGWLSRSAWALALVAQWRKSYNAGREPEIWLPDYFCDAALRPLRMTGARLVFYPVTATMEPDMPACRQLAQTSGPDVFMLVHYFGRPTPAAPVRDFCAERGAWLLEDAAQTLRPAGGMGENGDFVCYSPHKHLPIPDGAVLSVRTSGPGKLDRARIAAFGDPEQWAGQLSSLHGAMARAGQTRARGDLTWLLKRSLQKVGIRRLRQPPTSFRETAEMVEGPSDPFDAPRQSGLSRRLLPDLISGLDDVARERQRNQAVWDELVVGVESKRDAVLLEAADRPVQGVWTPYLSVYRASEATAERFHDDWRRRGIPVSTWPDLPPEVREDRSRHAVAWRLRHERLYLPVHQGLRADSLAKIDLGQA